MPDSPEQTDSKSPQPLDSMFPRLDDAQIASLAPFGQQRDVEAGAVIVD
jgi:hypothetical protein